MDARHQISQFKDPARLCLQTTFIIVLIGELGLLSCHVKFVLSCTIEIDTEGMAIQTNCLNSMHLAKNKQTTQQMINLCGVRNIK